jgi:ABC-2 type transporter
MMRGLWKLTWIEIKVFLREPLGAFGAIAVPVLFFVFFGRIAGRTVPTATSFMPASFTRVGLPVLASLLIVLNAVVSLITIISIYRESGILKRLRATPLHPQTILTAQVLVKLILSAVTLVLMLLAGKRYYPLGGLLIHSGSAHQHREHLIDRLCHCQHRSHGTLRAADRRRRLLSDDCFFGTLRAHSIAAAGAARPGEDAADNVCSLAARGNLEW